MQQEFSYQSFHRTIRLSDEVIDPDKIKASYTDGILAITVPKREELKPQPAQTIRIQ